MKESTFHYIWPNGRADLNRCDLELNDIQQNPLPMKGVIDVSVCFNQKHIGNLTLVIVTGGNWFQAIQLRIGKTYWTTSTLNVDSTIRPVRLPPRPLPFAIKGLVEEEISPLCLTGYSRIC
ncbi:uncharacterized protein LOC117135677 [Drosophila mauritiana]|uniref:Uncharacterized protein LOC117135677 n=1 Tax=Drosophila mauritiana TaxID=7226 RepID=A0A6P8J972_DROMA|nr:uncharacterized protein LOC117135677 [Drosophila mauritiana]